MKFNASPTAITSTKSTSGGSVSNFLGRRAHAERIFIKNVAHYTYPVASMGNRVVCAGDYRTLELHHGYVQWLFPIHEEGMNHRAQVLQCNMATVAVWGACGLVCALQYSCKYAPD
jgi:hypothetical protein